ncbi:hypothetical protein GIB67_011788, partial [Kingdonia uniflora]
MVKTRSLTRSEEREPRIMAKLAELKTRYFGQQSLVDPVPIPMEPTYQGLTTIDVNKTDKDYFWLCQFHYIILAEANREEYLSGMAESIVEDEDIPVGLGQKCSGECSRYLHLCTRSYEQLTVLENILFLKKLSEWPLMFWRRWPSRLLRGELDHGLEVVSTKLLFRRLPLPATFDDLRRLPNSPEVPHFSNYIVLRSLRELDSISRKLELD